MLNVKKNNTLYLFYINYGFISLATNHEKFLNSEWIIKSLSFQTLILLAFKNPLSSSKTLIKLTLTF